MSLTIKPAQATKPQGQNHVMPTAAEGTDAFQKVLEKQLSHQEAQNRQNETSNSAGVKKSNQSKSSRAEVQPEKSLARKSDVLKSAHDDHTKTGLNEKKAVAKYAESEARLDAGLSLPDGLLALQYATPIAVEVNVGAQALTLSNETDGGETQPTAPSIVDNPGLPLLSLVNITSTIQSKLDQSPMMMDRGALEKGALSAGNVRSEGVKTMGESIGLATDEKLINQQPVGTLNYEMGNADKQTALSQDFSDILKRSADSQDHLALKSTHKTNMAALPVNSNMATPSMAPPVLATTINSAQPVSNQIAAPLGTPAWNEAVGQKIIWMVSGEQQSATLTLNPPDLGPVQVVIQVHNDHADATFISQNPEVRQALEDGLDNLRHMMSNSGIELGQANVHAEQQSRPGEHQTSPPVNNLKGVSDIALATPDNLKAKVMVSNGLVDTFA